MSIEGYWYEIEKFKDLLIKNNSIKIIDIDFPKDKYSIHFFLHHITSKRLNKIVLLSIEKDILSKINYNNLIDNFIS